MDATQPQMDASPKADKVSAASSRPMWLRATIACLICYNVAMLLGIFLNRHLHSEPNETIPAAVSGNLVCEQPVFNMGTIPDRSALRVEHTFVLKNTSAKSTIEVEETERSCGCVIAETPPPIPPGQSLEFSVSIQLDEIKGEFHKTVTLYQHNGEPLVLTIMGRRDAELIAATSPPMLTINPKGTSSTSSER